MHRLIWIALSSLVVVVFAAAPALAQQDPFEPRNPGGGTGGQTTQPTPGQPDTGNQQAQEPPSTGQTTEGLPNTGADPKPWIVLAYGLIFIGAALVTVSRTLRVSPVAAPSAPPSRPGEARSAGSSR